MGTRQQFHFFVQYNCSIFDGVIVLVGGFLLLVVKVFVFQPSLYTVQQLKNCHVSKENKNVTCVATNQNVVLKARGIFHGHLFLH